MSDSSNSESKKYVPIQRPALAESVLELIGRTPMVRLNRLTPTENRADIFLKMESLNPGFSIKDRLCLAMIEAAEREGQLQPGYTVVEPTSGNTGIGLAIVCAVKGYRLILTMPDDMSKERQALMSNFGAQVVLTPARKTMQGAVEKAEEIVRSNPNCFMPNQFINEANAQVHRETTALEILATMEGKIDAFVAGIGTGGTITGVGEVLKREIPGLSIFGVEPISSAVINGGKRGVHLIQGIGAGFVPDVLNLDIVDEVLCCGDDEAYRIARRLAREEGISAGMSAGAAMWAALEVAKRLGPNKRVVTVLCDSWERYLSLEIEFASDEALNFVI